jgi:hypothetical protein
VDFGMGVPNISKMANSFNPKQIGKPQEKWQCP